MSLKMNEANQHGGSAERPFFFAINGRPAAWTMATSLEKAKAQFADQGWRTEVGGCRMGDVVDLELIQRV